MNIERSKNISFRLTIINFQKVDPGLVEVNYYAHELIEGLKTVLDIFARFGIDSKAKDKVIGI